MSHSEKSGLTLLHEIVKLESHGYSVSEQFQQLFLAFYETNRKIKAKTHLARLGSTSRDHFYTY